MKNPMTNLPGTKPGSSAAIPQHKFIAMGYTVPEVPRKTSTHQMNAKTGETAAPGLTTKAKKSR